MLIAMNRTRRWIARAGVAAMVALAWCWPAIVLAQAAAPQPSLRRSPPPWLGLLVMALLLAVVLGVSLMPSKRGHQD